MTCVFAGTLGFAFFACDDSTSADFLPRENSAEISSSEIYSSSSKKIISSSSEVRSSSSKKVVSSSSEDRLSSSKESVSSSSVIQSSSSKKSISSSSAVMPYSSDYELSSSSENSSSSFVSSSSTKKVIEIEGVEIPYTTECPEGVICTYAPTAQLNPNVDYGEFLDERDYHVYKTISFVTKLGKKQTWFAQNLNLAYLAPTTLLDSSSFCYDDDIENCAKFGRLYIYSAMMDSSAVYTHESEGCGMDTFGTRICADSARGICPAGWRVPNSVDRDNLVEFLREPYSDYEEYDMIKSSTGWDGDGNRDNVRGFSLLPAGYYVHGKKYADLGKIGGFWWNIDAGSLYAWAVFVTDSWTRSLSVQKYRDTGLPVRCVKG